MGELVRGKANICEIVWDLYTTENRKNFFIFISLGTTCILYFVFWGIIIVWHFHYYLNIFIKFLCLWFCWNYSEYFKWKSLGQITRERGKFFNLKLSVRALISYKYLPWHARYKYKKKYFLYHSINLLEKKSEILNSDSIFRFSCSFLVFFIDDIAFKCHFRWIFNERGKNLG